MDGLTYFALTTSAVAVGYVVGKIGWATLAFMTPVRRIDPAADRDEQVTGLFQQLLDAIVMHARGIPQHPPGREPLPTPPPPPPWTQRNPIAGIVENSSSPVSCAHCKKPTQEFVEFAKGHPVCQRCADALGLEAACEVSARR